MHFCSFPSILKGWIDRVFTLDFAFGLTSEGWRGDVNGRIPLLYHQRALIMSSTIFDQHAYHDGIRDAIGKVIDDWGFRFPGIADVEHVYFYAATAAPPATIQRYLDQAYQLGRNFGLPRSLERRSQRPLSPSSRGFSRSSGKRLVSGGTTCDRCVDTQHEVEHAVHTLEQTLRSLGIEPHLEIRELDESSFKQDMRPRGAREREFLVAYDGLFMHRVPRLLPITPGTTPDRRTSVPDRFGARRRVYSAGSTPVQVPRGSSVTVLTALSADIVSMSMAEITGTLCPTSRCAGE